MTERYLESRGIAYRTNEFKEERSTLVFIHGLSVNLTTFTPYEERFADKYNTLSIDLRGHGLSKRYPSYSDYSLDKFADDISALLEHLHIEKCVLLSHSMGALIALDLIHRHPEKITKAIFVSPASNASKLLFYHMRHPLRALGFTLALLGSFFRAPKGRTNYVSYYNTGDWNMHRAFVDVSNMGQVPYLYSLNNLYAFGHEEWWGEIKIPVLIMHGTKDTMVPVA